MLILQNHDLDREALREAGFTTQYSLALNATDPPVVLSHYPLHHLPVGAMNVHGHLHNQFEPTAWHINLAVEGTDYSSVGLVWVLDKARQRHAAFRLSRGHGQVVREGARRALHEVDLGRAQERQMAEVGLPRPMNPFPRACSGAGGMLTARGDSTRYRAFSNNSLGPGVPGGSAPSRDPGEHGAGEINASAGAPYQPRGGARQR